MLEIKLNISENLLISLNQNVEEFEQQLRLASALELFKSHKLSLGKAAELAELSRIDFMFELGKRKIPIIDYPPEDLEKELEVFES